MNSAGQILIWSLVLIGFLVGMFLLVIRIKHMVSADAGGGGGGAGFTLSDLRQLHRDGQMSDDEFERAKAKIIEAAQKAAARQQQAAAAQPARHGQAGGIEPKFDR
jgi:hypothetical protein